MTGRDQYAGPVAIYIVLLVCRAARHTAVWFVAVGLGHKSAAQSRSTVDLASTRYRKARPEAIPGVWLSEPLAA